MAVNHKDEKAKMKVTVVIRIPCTCNPSYFVDDQDKKPKNVKTMRWKIYIEICLLSCFYLLQLLLLFACLSLHWILVSGHFPQTAPIAGLCKNVGVRFREHIA